MDAVFLSRLQFGLTAFFHFLFPLLTIGLATMIAVIEYFYWRRGENIYDKMARFWFRIFAILFAVGVASGITTEVLRITLVGGRGHKQIMVRHFRQPLPQLVG